MKKKVFAVIACVAMMAAGALATYAYFTDTDEATNTFTVGDIDILLDETDTDGSKTNVTEGSKPTRDKENEYHILPGLTYDKDPMVTVLGDSENCYIYVTVDNQIADIEAQENNIASQMADNGWSALEDGRVVITKDGLTVYCYESHVAKNAEAQEFVIFEKFTIDGDKVVNQANVAGKKYLKNYEDAQIIVKAYAVQKDGFGSALDAWKATFGK